MEKNYKRRNFFINKRYQGRFMFQFYLLLAVATVIFSLILVYLTSDSLTIVYQNNDIQVGRTPLLFFQQLLKTSWFLLIPFGFVVIIIALFQTHRTAGPLFKFEKVLSEMIDGHIGQTVYLRQKDEGKDLAQKLTDLNKKLAATMTGLGNLSSQLATLIEHKDISDPQQRAKVVEISREIQEMVKAYTISDQD